MKEIADSLFVGWKRVNKDTVGYYSYSDKLSDYRIDFCHIVKIDNGWFPVILGVIKDESPECKLLSEAKVWSQDQLIALLVKARKSIYGE